MILTQACRGTQPASPGASSGSVPSAGIPGAAPTAQPGHGVPLREAERAPGPGLPPRPARPGVVPLPRSRRPKVGSGSGGDFTGPEAMREADGARGLGGTGRGGDEGGTVRGPEPSARSAGASRSLQQRRPNQSPRSRRGQTSPETPPALLTAEGLAGARLGGSTARAHSEAPVHPT